jgi:glycosyltransferase involved in cell wall biosynthesis
VRLAIVNLTQGGMSGGYRSYLRALIPLLVRDPRLSHLAIFCHRNVLREWGPGDGDSSFWHGYVRRTELQRAVTQWDPDAVFIPTARWVSLGAPTTVMVRNMEPLAFAGAVGSAAERLRNFLRLRAARSSCTKADRVIAVSTFVQDHIIREFRVPADKIAVVHHGSERIAEPGETRRPSCLSPEISSGFVFTGGSIRPARGLQDLVRALAFLRTQGIVVPAVIAGAVDRGGREYRHYLEELAARSGVSEQIHWVGQLDAAEMAWCYDNAHVFVMTSRVEACPNTALEAMAHGAACVASDCPPMPEIFGQGARYYRPGDSARLATELISLLGMQDTREAARRRAVARAEDFSWAETARLTLDQLEKSVIARRMT